jgi:hypothetical protein
MGIAARTPIPLLSSPLKGEGRMATFLWRLETTFSPDSAYGIGGKLNVVKQGVFRREAPPCLAPRAFPPASQGGHYYTAPRGDAASLYTPFFCCAGSAGYSLPEAVM